MGNKVDQLVGLPEGILSELRDPKKRRTIWAARKNGVLGNSVPAEAYRRKILEQLPTRSKRVEK